MMSIKYRPEIDGLRAIAVISVIIFHLNETWLPGGFLGVDIFFVISGFLITSIILREAEENRFTFKNFYTRRIKRI
ncbi:acyltransferase family protein, partial [Rodentibacter pneumotropicus]